MDLAMSNMSGSGFDFAHDGTDLVVDDGLVTLLIHALFRDGRAPDDILPPGEDRRGHWASGFEENSPDGSWLWLLSREKITPDMPHRIAELIEKACVFMITATEGPAAPVSQVRATCYKSARRGRIEGELIVFLNQSLEQRRFAIVYYIQGNQYQLKEIT